LAWLSFPYATSVNGRLSGAFFNTPQRPTEPAQVLMAPEAKSLRCPVNVSDGPPKPAICGHLKTGHLI
jgi:hypothetical protein